LQQNAISDSFVLERTLRLGRSERSGSWLCDSNITTEHCPRWFMQLQRADPNEAMMIASACGARQVFGIHWNTFPLTDKPYAEPAELLTTAAREARISDIAAQALRPGDIWEAGKAEP
jgi:hypothetical protein